MSGNFQFETYSRFSDRRLHARHRVLLSCLELNEDNGGIILDISEQGLAMQAVKSLGEAPYTQLRFQLSQSKEWVDTRGRIAWISASRQTAGVEFIDLPCESLNFIKKWISSIACPSANEEESAIPESVASLESALTLYEAANVTSTPATTMDLAGMLHGVGTNVAGGPSGTASGEHECRTVSENVRPIKAVERTLSPQGVRSDRPLMNNEPLVVTSQPRRHIVLMIGIALLLSALISVGYSLRNPANGRPYEKARSSEEPSEVPPNGSSSSMIAPRAFTDSSSFILQVAATKDEKSAILLAGLLRRKGFPVFVFQPAADSYYRVFVGPYSDAASAVKVEGELRKQGFDVIRKRNTPAR